MLPCSLTNEIDEEKETEQKYILCGGKRQVSTLHDINITTDVFFFMWNFDSYQYFCLH